MLFCFTIYGHGGHFSQVTQNKYHIYIVLFTEYKPYKIWVQTVQWFLRKRCLETYVEVQNEWPWMKGQRSAWLAQWFQRRRCLKMLTDGRQRDWYTISSPVSLQLRWAKKVALTFLTRGLPSFAILTSFIPTPRSILLAWSLLSLVLLMKVPRAYTAAARTYKNKIIQHVQIQVYLFTQVS